MTDKDGRKVPADTELVPARFTPLDSAGGKRRLPLTPGYLALAALVLVAALILAYLFAARAVIFRLVPADATLRVSGIAFSIGDNYLLLPGEHQVKGKADGYVTLQRTVVVSDEKTQEIELRLEPLPGKLELASNLDGIEVRIDGRRVGTAPGLVEDIPRGIHDISFRKHRYFPLEREIEIEGLGRTQSLNVELEPAWGQMQIRSRPTGAEVYIDGRLVGNTPLTTEVLETGSLLTLSAPGYRTWEKEVSVEAGTTATYPTVELTVADGTVDIGSTPPGASVTIDDQFRGVTPLTVSLSPLRPHRVELFLEGYRKAVRTLRVEPEESHRLGAELSPIIGDIELTVAPSDAEVLVDGDSRGRGSQKLALIAREHRVTVRKPGYQAQTVTVTPRPDHPQSLGVELLTLEQAYWATRPPRITSPVASNLTLFRPDVTFTLGAPRREPGRRANEAERTVRLERPFYIGTHEVTNGQFRQWRPEHTSGAIKGHTLDMDNQPVANVSWQEAALFCNWLSRQEGLAAFYVVANGLVVDIETDADGYRLPTEAEWAWLAKINSTGGVDMFPWSSDQYPPPEPTANYADQSAAGFLNFTLSGYDDGYPAAAPVGSFSPNHRGLFDMSGNVSEWISDYYDIRLSRGEPELDPTGPESGSRHVIRGASWALASRSELRWSYREAGDGPRIDTGFRLARYVDKADIGQ